MKIVDIFLSKQYSMGCDMYVCERHINISTGHEAGETLYMKGREEMRKKLSCMASVMLAVSLTACSGGAQEAPTTASLEPTTAAPTTEAPTTEAETEAPEGALTPGTYTAAKGGMNGQVEVEVVTDDTSIVSVKVTKDQETPGIGSPLVDGEKEGTIPTIAIPAAIVENQSIAVDAVAGATITSAAIKSAVEDCMTQAGANVDDWKTPVDKEAPQEIEMDADVIVVGGGGAGLAAAISASQNGAKVIVVEKNGAVGGDTLVCGAIYNNPDEELQSKVEMSDAVKKTLEAGIAVEPVDDAHKELMDTVAAEWKQHQADGKTTLFDSEAWFTLQTYNGGDNVAELPLVKVLCENAVAGYDWIQELGMEFNDTIGQGAGSLWQRTHTSTKPMGTGFISTYVENIAADDNIQMVTSTTAKKLVQDDTGRVVGVEAEDVNGNTYKFSASKGVVLAAGGFAANSKMVNEYNTTGKWDDLSKVPTTNRFSCSQGDGILMAQEIGAALSQMEQIQLLYLGNVRDGGLTKYPARCVNGTDQEIFINKNGERFVREDGRRDEICLQVLNQPDAMFYFLESADGDYTDVETALTADGFTFQEMEEQGYIIIADTLDEMAEKLGCDAETLKATVDTFNASVDSGEDEFGRTLYSVKLENGPFVATPRQACLHHTMGGVKIDTEGRVLDESGAPIEGLVAAGEITGGIHGGNRLGGNAVVDTVVFGKLAGETITK